MADQAESENLEDRVRSMLISEPRNTSQMGRRGQAQSLGAQVTINGERLAQHNQVPAHARRHISTPQQSSNAAFQTNNPAIPNQYQPNLKNPRNERKSYHSAPGPIMQQPQHPQTFPSRNSQTPPQRSAQPAPRYGNQRQNGYSSAPSRFVPLSRPQQSFIDHVKAQGDFLEQVASSWLPQLEMSKEEFDSKDAFRAHIEQACQEAAIKAYQADPLKIGLAAFGSFSSGFAMPGSDMDLALIMSRSAVGLPRVLEKCLLELGHGARLLSRTRVPIIKICERPTPELYAALLAEREKWDAMSPEEQERYDQTGRADEEPPKERTEGADQRGAAVETVVKPDGHGEVKSEGEEEVPDSNQQSEGTLDPEKKKRRQRKPRSILNVAIGGPGSPDLPDAKDSTGNEDISDSGTLPTNDATTLLQPSGSTTTTNSINTNKSHTQPKSRQQRPWYREKRLGPLDFPKSDVGILCDINFSNPLGLHNTHLLRCYSHCDVRVRLMVLFVKAWASKRKINSGYNGTLSSYGYVLMVLHFLVNIAQPPVCPNLQLARRPANAPWDASASNDPNATCEGWDVRFWRNEQEILQLAAKNMLTHNQQPLGALLRDFFLYYAKTGYDVPRGGYVWTQEVLSLRTPGGILSKEAKGWTGAKTTVEDKKEIRHRYLFAIEDPFELSHNVARTVTHGGIVAIRDEFRRAWRILTQVGRGQPPEGDLFAQVEDVAPPVVEKKIEEVQAREGQAEVAGSAQEQNAPGESTANSAIATKGAGTKEEQPKNGESSTGQA